MVHLFARRCSWRKDQPGVGACDAPEAWGGRGRPRRCTIRPRGAGGHRQQLCRMQAWLGALYKVWCGQGGSCKACPQARRVGRLAHGGCMQALPVLDSAKHPGVPSCRSCCAAHAARQVSALVFYEPLAAWHHAAFARFPGVRPSAAASAASLMCVPEASL